MECFYSLAFVSFPFNASIRLFASCSTCNSRDKFRSRAASFLRTRPLRKRLGIQLKSRLILKLGMNPTKPYVRQSPGKWWQGKNRCPTVSDEVFKRAGKHKHSQTMLLMWATSSSTYVCLFPVTFQESNIRDKIVDWITNPFWENEEGCDYCVLKLSYIMVHYCNCHLPHSLRSLNGNKKASSESPTALFCWRRFCLNNFVHRRLPKYGGGGGGGGGEGGDSGFFHEATFFMLLDDYRFCLRFSTF